MMMMRAISGTASAEMSSDLRSQIIQNLRATGRLQVRIRGSSCLTHQLVQFSLRGGNYKISPRDGKASHLEFR